MSLILFVHVRDYTALASFTAAGLSLAIDKPARSAASRCRTLLSPRTQIPSSRNRSQGNRKTIGCCSSICPFSVNWKNFFPSLEELIERLQSRSGMLVSGWISVLLIRCSRRRRALYRVLSGGSIRSFPYGQLGFLSIHIAPLWSSRKTSTGGPERFLFAAISAKTMLRTNATGSSCSKSGFLDRKSSIA